MVSLLNHADPVDIDRASQDTGFENPGFSDVTTGNGVHGDVTIGNGVHGESRDTGPGIPTHCIHVAGVYVSDALSFRNLKFRTDRLSLYQSYQDGWLRLMFTLFMLMLLGLALFENPAVPGVNNVHWQATLTIEILCILACIGRVVHLKLCLHSRDFWLDPKNIVVILVIIGTLLDIVVWTSFKLAAGDSVIRVTRVLRPLIIVNFSENRNLRKLLRNIRRTVLDAVSVLVLIFLIIAIFAMMATKFFERRSLINPQGEKYLDNMADSYWNLYVLMTTANSPDVSLPALRDEQAFFFFFAPFSVITSYVLMNILLAVVYKHYKIHLLEEIKTDVIIIEDNLNKAFNLLKDQKTNVITRDTWRGCYRSLGCKDELQKLYWEYLVSGETGGIDLASFLKITDLLSSKIKVVKNTRTLLERVIPGIYNSSVSCYLRFVVNHLYFTLFYDLLIFLNSINLALNYDLSPAEEIFLVAFNVEILLKLYTYGPVKFSSSAWNVYDCVVIWSATVFKLVEDAVQLHEKNEEMGKVLLDMVLTLRVLRLLKLLYSFPKLRHIISTLVTIVPSMGSYFALLFLFYYFFAILGMEWFGGLILNETDAEMCGNPKLNGTEFVTEGYCVLNFNNIIISFIVLWTLMLVNQWHIIAEGFVAVTNEGARVYFISFHICIVLIILNIFLAFIIEAFIMQSELDKAQDENIEKHLNERGVNARKASQPMEEALWYREQSGDETRSSVVIGLNQVTDKIKYKRQQSAKSYNQLLLDMFQGDLRSEGGLSNPSPTTTPVTTPDQESSKTITNNSVSGDRAPANGPRLEERSRLTSVVEEADEGVAGFSDISIDRSGLIGSLETLDII